MELRKYTRKDFIPLLKILKEEGIDVKDTALSEGETWIQEDEKKIQGFFTFEKDRGRIHLIHFWIAPQMRGGKTFFRMAKMFKDKVKETGVRSWTLNVPEDKGDVLIFCRRYLRVKEYGYRDNQYYFLTGVNQNGKQSESTVTASN